MQASGEIEGSLVGVDDDCVAPPQETSIQGRLPLQIIALFEVSGDGLDSLFKK